MEKIGVIVGGGPAPGINSVIALERADRFKKVEQLRTAREVTAELKGGLFTDGEIRISADPDGSSRTRLTAVSTAAVDNIWALFQSPNDRIMTAFKQLLDDA